MVLLTSGATALVIERRSGILQRLASAPIRRSSVVMGKWGGKFGLAVLIGRFALGGCFWPIELTPDYMQKLSLFLPTGWMMDAIHKLMIFERDWTAALPHMTGMLAGAWLLGLLCARKFRFQ